MFTAADIVADPVAPDAFVEGIMENKEWVWDNGVIKQKDIEEYKEHIQKAKKELDEKKLKVFKSFLKKQSHNIINIIRKENKRLFLNKEISKC